MPENKFIHVKSPLNIVLSKYNIQEKINQERLLNEWENIIGKTIAKHCIPVQIENKILTLKISNEIWKKELSRNRDKIIKLISEYFGSRIIEKLILVQR